jgi:Flp pilus assembly protein TadD
VILPALLLQVAAAMPLLERSDFAAARPILEKACAAHEANACYLYGRTLLSLDLYQLAIHTLEPLRKTDPFPWRIDDALALAHEALRNTQKAEELYRAAVKANAAQSPDPAHHYARFLIREGRPADAVELAAPLAEKFPSHQPLRFELGRALYMLRRLPEAARHLAAAPGLEEARLLLAKVQRQLQPDRP